MSSAQNATMGEHAVAFAGRFEWRCVAVGTTITLLYGATLGLVIQHVLPLWVGFFVNTWLAYFSFGPIHEAMHGNVSGKGGTPNQGHLLDSVFGWMWSWLLMTPYSSYRKMHLAHHAHTNDPERDVNYYVKADNWWTSAWLCIKARVGYILIMKRHGPKPSLADKRVRNAVILAALMNYGALGILLTSALMGHFVEVFFLWYLPGNIAIVMLELLFAYLPHHPHTSQDPFKATRVVTFPLSTYLLMGNNYHILHHLFPRVPFYHLPQLFGAIERELTWHGVVMKHFRFSR